MKTLLGGIAALGVALITSATCVARPMIIHQSQTLQPPAGYYFFGYDLAIDGDWAIVIAGSPSATPANPQETHDALLYHRVNGVWTLDRTLVHRVSTTYPTNPLVYFKSVAMSNGVAAIGSDPTRIFKRTNNTWAEIAHPFTAPEGNPDWVSGDLLWDGNTLLATRYACDSSLTWGALLSRLNADGSWSPLERLSSGDTNCDYDPWRWGISGNTVVAATYPLYLDDASPRLSIFRRSGTTWMPTVAISGGQGMGDVSGNDIFIPSRLHGATAVYRNDDSRTVVDTIRTVSASYGDSWNAWGFTHSDDVFVQQGDLFRKNAAGKYEHVAILKPRGGPYSMAGDVKINGRRAISQVYRDHDSSHPAAAIFDLPATYTPSRVVATGFENSGQPPINPQVNTFAVTTRPNGNHVYRQSSTTGEYRALIANTDWEEQSIEADIKPTAFAGEAWAGLAVRHLDDANYYAVALRSTGVVELRFMRNGVSTTVTQKPLAIVAGRAYHVSLQAYGTMITVRIDGNVFLYHEEARPVPKGSAALLGNGTAVEYDNIVVAQVGQRPIFGLFYTGCDGPLDLSRTPEWTINGTGNWNCASETGQNVMQQTSTAGGARAAVGTSTDDQVVTTRARATAFADSNDRWFGIVARYVDDSNYYFLTVRNSNTVSLRKVVNGVVTVLKTATLTVRPNTWYDLRLDAVGNELRGFINGAQVLQTTDASHASGKGGIVTYRAAAEYANYLSWQP